MLSNNLSLWMIPLASVATTLILWACCTLAAHLLQKRTDQDVCGPAPDPLALSHPVDAGMRRAEVRVRVAWGMLAITPIVALGAFVTLALTHGRQPIGTVALVLFGSAAILWAYAVYRWRDAARRLRVLQWGGEAKSQVDRAVSRVCHDGQVVLHDIVADGGTIDHLIAGPKGVFAVFTLLSTTPALIENQKGGPIVTYDGWMLRFPHGEDHQSIQKADQVTEQLSEWISERLDIPLAARAILALPGWRIKRISAEGISVINPAQMESFFEHVKPRPLAEGSVRRIVALLEQHRATVDAAPVGTRAVPTIAATAAEGPN
jgi:hypothetical protein